MQLFDRRVSSCLAGKTGLLKARAGTCRLARPLGLLGPTSRNVLALLGHLMSRRYKDLPVSPSVRCEPGLLEMFHSYLTSVP